MDLGMDESATPGECPLCQAAVPDRPGPGVAGDFLPLLAQHFAASCRAIAFPLPAAART